MDFQTQATQQVLSRVAVLLRCGRDICFASNHNWVVLKEDHTDTGCLANLWQSAWLLFGVQGYLGDLLRWGSVQAAPYMTNAHAVDHAWAIHVNHNCWHSYPV